MREEVALPTELGNLERGGVSEGGREVAADWAGIGEMRSRCTRDVGFVLERTTGTCGSPEVDDP